MKLHSLVPSLVLSGLILSHPEAASRAQSAPSSVGSLDTSFFARTLIVPSWNGISTVRRLVVQPDGRVLVGGKFDHVQNYRRCGLARLEAGGALDVGFVPAVEFIEDLALEPNGKIVVAATYRGLARLNPDGTLDGSFDGQVKGGATAVARLPSGEFLAAIPVDKETDTSPGKYTVALFDAQGVLSSRWSTWYRSTSPPSYILVAPDAGRAVIDGAVEFSLAGSGNNFRWLTNALPPRFRTRCGIFQPDGKLLLGGEAPYPEEFPGDVTLSPALVRLNADGTRDTSFAPDASIGTSVMEDRRDQLRIAALALQPDGQILIGGFFMRVQGEPRPLVARLQSDGRLDAAFAPDIEISPGVDIDALQNVSALAVTPEGKLLAGGVFSRCNGLECYSLIRLHTAADTGGGVLAFAQEAYYAWETDGALQVDVLRFGPSERAISVAYEAVEPLPGVTGSTPLRGTLVFGPGEIRKTITVPIQDNLVAEGNHAFRLVLSAPAGGAALTSTPETRVVVLDEETLGRPGSVDLWFPPLDLDGRTYNATVLAVEPDGSALFSAQTATDCCNFASAFLRIGPDGRVDPTFHPSTDQAVYGAFPDPASGKILIVGAFSMVNGQSRTQLARLDHDGSLDLTFQATCDSWVNGAIVQPDGKIVIYGYFNTVNGVPHRQLARLQPDGTLDLTFGAPRDWIPSLSCIAGQGDGKIVIGGSFAQIDGVSRTNLARFNSDGSLDLSFVPPPTRNAPSIQTLLCQPDGKLLVSGQLFLPDGRPARLLRLNADGSLDTTFAAALPARVQGRSLLLQPDGRILLDGKWRLNPDGSRDHSYFTSDETIDVSGAVLLPGGDLLVSGDFASFAGWPRPYLVRLHGGTAPAFGFFEFAESCLTVSEEAGSAQVRVRRLGATNEAARVDLTTVEGTARAGVDYTPFSATLTFAPGTAEQTATIPLLRRAGYQGDRSFALHLQDRTAGIRAPAGPDGIVLIRETEFGLSFSQTNYWIFNEVIATNGAGAWVANVQRHGDLTGTLTVQCQLVAGTAVAGQDFIATNITLLFQPQQSEVQVIAPVLRNDAAVADRTLFLVLNHPVPDISLATDATAMLTLWGKSRPPTLVPAGSVLDTNGCMRLVCDTEPNQFLMIEASTDLVNWTYLGYAYREPNTAPVVVEDPDAWKYPRRFYRIPLYQSGD